MVYVYEFFPRTDWRKYNEPTFPLQHRSFRTFHLFLPPAKSSGWEKYHWDILSHLNIPKWTLILAVKIGSRWLLCSTLLTIITVKVTAPALTDGTAVSLLRHCSSAIGHLIFNHNDCSNMIYQCMCCARLLQRYYSKVDQSSIPHCCFCQYSNRKGTLKTWSISLISAR